MMYPPFHPIPGPEASPKRRSLPKGVFGHRWGPFRKTLDKLLEMVILRVPERGRVFVGNHYTANSLKVTHRGGLLWQELAVSFWEV